jgi:hypothetical protein
MVYVAVGEEEVLHLLRRRALLALAGAARMHGSATTARASEI